MVLIPASFSENKSVPFSVIPYSVSVVRLARNSQQASISFRHSRHF